MEPVRCYMLEDTGRVKVEVRPCRCGCGQMLNIDTPVYRRLDTGVELFLASAPVGAMWYADWMLSGKKDNNQFRGPDGHCLVVRLPGNHDWMVDGRCSNCGLPADNVHKCWVRHGVPPALTVDKVGVTCPAGGGSIMTPNWHGFLQDGFLVTC